MTLERDARRNRRKGEQAGRAGCRRANGVRIESFREGRQSIEQGARCMVLLVTANAMMMNQRERRSEVAVMKTVGLSDARVFGLVIIEAAVISLTGAVLGLGAATLLPVVTGFGEGGFLPGFRVTLGTQLVGAAVALLLTVASGVFPAWQAANLPVVDALRRVE